MEDKNNVTENKVTQNENIEKVNTEVATLPVNAKGEPPAENQEQINWRKFREARELERRQKVEAEKKASEKEAEVQALQAALAAVVNKPAAKIMEVAQSSFEEESDAERIRRQVDEAIADRDKKNEIERLKREHAEFPSRVQSNFKDFDQVCTAENLDYLEYHYPEVASPYKHLPDGYEKWASIYQAVKRFVPNTNSKKDAARAEKNLTKPQSMSIAGKTQVGDTAPQQLDDKRRSDNWQRMQRVMKGG